MSERWKDDLFLALVVALVVALLTLGCTLAVHGAPVPTKVKKPVKAQTAREGVIAARQLNWVSGDTVRFFPDGGYEWTSGSIRYVGTWQMIGTNVLKVREAPLNPRDGTLGAWMDWQVTLLPQLEKLSDKGKALDVWRGQVTGSYGAWPKVRLVPGERLKMPKE